MNWNIGQTILGQYVVKEVFTGGGMGEVYRVHHLGWNLDLALKRPNEEYSSSHDALSAFESEIETWAELGLHPNIATCYYSRKIDGVSCAFAEFVDGGSLYDWIQNRRLYRGGEQAATSRILSVAVQCAWGLAWAHQHGLVHQDVKSGNVLMAVDGTAKVTDFGLTRSRQFTSALTDASPARTATFAGWTPLYGSPEQAARLRVSAATDVWSWAVSVLEMFMGGIHWHSGPAASESLKAYNQEGRRSREMPEMPRELVALLWNCLNREPTKRPKSFEYIADILLKIHIRLFGEPCDVPSPDIELIAADALNNRGVSLMDVKRRGEALIRFEKALHVDPNHPEAVCNHALALYRDGRLSTSAGTLILEGALQNDVGDAHALKLLGMTLFEIGEFARASRALALAKKASRDLALSNEIDSLLVRLTRGGKAKGLMFPSNHYFLAQPRTGEAFLADAARFDRLLTKAEAAVKDLRHEDARRYLQMSADILGYARHPRAKKLLQAM